MREKPLTLCKYFAEAMNYKHIFPILLAGCILAGCQQGRYATFSGFAQGGTYTVKADLRSVSVPAEQIQQRIDAILDSIDFSLSGYNKNSLLSRYNAGEEIVPDRFFREVRELSVRYREQTGGAFDVAAGPLFDIWGFGFTSDSLPDPERVRAALAACKEEKVLNFNAIAQGYTCDVVADYLHEIGVHNMLVDIGEIIRDGKKYAHTIDPRTGYPVEHNLLSATVVAPTAAEADALATACMVIGPKQARALIESRPDLEGYLITAEGIWMSDGFAERARGTEFPQK